jgi:hypothetical protein
VQLTTSGDQQQLGSALRDKSLQRVTACASDDVLVPKKPNVGTMGKEDANQQVCQLGDPST